MEHNNKQVERIFAVNEYDDGSMQIVIIDKDGNILDNTQEFRREQLRDYLSVFFNIEERREDTAEFKLIPGGLE